ncbi:MAG: phasin family protein [Anaerolineales bacterium]|jgi:polyhydroxyalkanoate synthesis regulator phasin
MATKAKKQTEETTEEERRTILEMARKVLLAGMGAVALAQDEVEAFVNKLIERGEIAEKDGKNLIADLREKRKKETKKAESEVNKRIEEVLDRLNVPSKADIEALNQKIATLTEKIDELKEAQAQ